MKTTDIELCALKNNETYTLGRGRTYSAAIQDARLGRDTHLVRRIDSSVLLPELTRCLT